MIKYTPKPPPEDVNVNVTPGHPLKDFFTLLVGLILIIVAVYILLGFAVDIVAPYVPHGAEQKMGNYFIRAIPEDARLEKPARRLQKIADEMQQECVRIPYTFQVHVIDNPAVNAVALPGGHIVFFSGLINAVSSENELVFVLAHEMGHFVNRDHLRRLGRTLIMMTASALVFGSESNIGRIIGGSVTMTELSFSRKQESEADKYGLSALYCHYGHVGGAADFFKKILKEKTPARFGHYFSTHPETKRRIAAIKTRAENKGFPFGPTKPLPAALRIPQTSAPKGDTDAGENRPPS